MQENDHLEENRVDFAGHKTRLLLRLQLSIDNLVIAPDYQSITVLTPNPFDSTSLQQLISTYVEI